jgi:hypothetical protein
MLDSRLYDKWMKELFANGSPHVDAESWLRTSLIALFSNSCPVDSLAPFAPWDSYVFDEESATKFVYELRQTATATNAKHELSLRTGIANVISNWDFENDSLRDSIRLSFVFGKLFHCNEVCDTLSLKKYAIIRSHIEVITGLADLLASFGKVGGELIIQMVNEMSVSIARTGNVAKRHRGNDAIPYLLIRAIESCDRADLTDQRHSILSTIERTQTALEEFSVSSPTAASMLTTRIASGLRIIETTLTTAELDRLSCISGVLDNESLTKYIPQIQRYVPRLQKNEERNSIESALLASA